jgi:hypothetical protein
LIDLALSPREQLDQVLEALAGASADASCQNMQGLLNQRKIA